MKTVVDRVTKVSYEVSEDTPVTTINGVHYILSDSEQAELIAKETAWLAEQVVRQLDKVYDKRIKEYGTYGEQLDLMYHEGFQAWTDHIAAVKLANPKP